MASNDELPLLVHSSDNIEQGARLAWNQVSSVAEDVPEPTIGKAAGFLPSELCYKAMNLALEEYLQKTSIPIQHRKISKSRKGGVVYFPGQPKIADTFTIMIPISVQGNVEINGIGVKMENYYHIMQECFLEIPSNGKLVALIIDNIVL